MEMFIFDLDGTLLADGGLIDKLTLSVIHTLRKQGSRVGIATGRPYHNVLKSVPTLVQDFDVLICENGGFVHDFNDNSVHEQFPLSGDLVREIIDRYLPFGMNPILTGDDVLLTQFRDFYDQEVATFLPFEYVNVREHVGSHHAKIIFSGEPESLARGMDAYRMSSDDRYTAFYSQQELLEFMDPRVNKMMGLRYYLEKYDLHPKDVMAFGDNDIALIGGVGHAVAMENATANVKAVASNYCGANHELSVYKDLLNYLDSQG